MYRQLVAVLHRCADAVDVREVQTRMHALDVHVQGHVHDVEVAGALAIAKQAAFQTVCAGQQGHLGSRCASAAVVMGVHGQHNGVTALDIAVRPLHHVGKHIGAGVLDGCGQVDDALLIRCGLPDFCHGVDHALGELHFGVRVHLGRVLESPVRLRVFRCDVLEQLGIAARQLHDLVFAHAQHHAAHHRCCRVVQVNNGTGYTFQGFKSAAHQMLTCLGQHLHGHVIRNALFLDELAHEVELDLRSRRKAHFNFLEADLDQLLEHAHLALDIHGLDQRLVAVAQVHAAPDGGLADGCVRPGTVSQTNRYKRTVLACGVLQHRHRSSLS